MKNNTLVKNDDQESIRSYNRVRILRQLFECGPMSRNLIAENIGLTGATVSRIVAECIEAGLIIEDRAPTTVSGVGRKPVPISLNNKHYFVAAVHIGVLWLDIALMNLRGEIIKYFRHNKLNQSPEEVIAIIKMNIYELLDNHPGSLLAIGVTLNGQIDVPNGEVLERNVLGWNRVPIRSMLERELKVHTVLDTNVYAMAITEYSRNPLPSDQPLVLVNIGTTVGIGTVINNSIVRGYQGLAGAVEHLPFLMDGPECECGNSGCVTCLLSDLALLKKARKIYPVRTLDTINDLIMASETEEKITHLLKERAYYVGLFLASLAVLHDPGRIILSGSCLLGNGNQMNWVREAYKSRLSNRKYVEITHPQVSKELLFPLSGAGNIAIQSVFSQLLDFIPLYDTEPYRKQVVLPLH